MPVGLPRRLSLEPQNKEYFQDRFAGVPEESEYLAVSAGRNEVGRQAGGTELTTHIHVTICDNIPHALTYSPAAEVVILRSEPP